MRFLRNKRNLVTIVSALLLAGLSLVAYLYQPVENIDLNTYKRLLDQNRFTKASIVGNRVILDTPEKSYAIIRSGIDIAELLHKVPVEIREPKSDRDMTLLLLFLIAVTLFAFLFGKKRVRATQRRGRGEFERVEAERLSLGEREIVPVTSEVTFADVAGIDEVKEELTEIVDFLKNAQKYRARYSDAARCPARRSSGRG